MNNYLLTSAAEKDIDEIASYIAKDNLPAALKIIDTFYEAMEMLGAHPHAGRVRTDVTNRPVRFWPVKSNYLMIYSDTKPIEILRILSTYRDIAALFF